MRRIAIIVGACLILLTVKQAYAGAPHGVACDFQKVPCISVMESGTEVSLSILPTPVRAMQDVEFLITVRRTGKPVIGATLTLHLTMPGMVMGSNRPKLKEEGNGYYRGRGVFPRCPSGKGSWKSSIEVTQDGHTERTAFHFEVR